MGNCHGLQRSKFFFGKEVHSCTMATSHVCLFLFWLVCVAIAEQQQIPRQIPSGNNLPTYQVPTNSDGLTQAEQDVLDGILKFKRAVPRYDFKGQTVEPNFDPENS